MTKLTETFPDRLAQLSDGRPGLRSLLTVEISEPNHETRNTDHASDPQPSTTTSQPVLDFIASDATLDRYSEIISPAGWKLDAYQRNPVFQNSHQYGDILFTLGRALVTEVRTLPPASPSLFQRVQFATDVNPMAKIAYGLYKGKFLNAVSVGFIPVRWENGTEKTDYTRRYTEQELLEVSAVSIPANPNALALGLKSGALERSDLRDLFDLLRHTLAGKDAGGKPTLGPSVPDQISQPSTINSQLVRLAIQLHSILKS